MTSYNCLLRTKIKLEANLNELMIKIISYNLHEDKRRTCILLSTPQEFVTSIFQHSAIVDCN
jgi:hypothetical protein